MATTSINAKTLKTKMNYGKDAEGKDIIKTKSYNNVAVNANDDNILDVYDALTSLQSADEEGCYVQTTVELVR